MPYGVRITSRGNGPPSLGRNTFALNTVPSVIGTATSRSTTMSAAATPSKTKALRQTHAAQVTARQRHRSIFLVNEKPTALTGNLSTRQITRRREILGIL
jgi:hypothetical protein